MRVDVTPAENLPPRADFQLLRKTDERVDG